MYPVTLLKEGVGCSILTVFNKMQLVVTAEGEEVLMQEGSCHRLHRQLPRVMLADSHFYSSFQKYKIDGSMGKNVGIKLKKEEERNTEKPCSHPGYQNGCSWGRCCHFIKECWCNKNIGENIIRKT